MLEVKEVTQAVTHSPEETQALGRRLAEGLEPPCLVLLEGELASGKTTLAKGIVAGLGVAGEEEVTSPSFTLVHEYGEVNKVYHVDLYRIETPQELATLGLDDFFFERAIVLVEWGEKLGNDVTCSKIRIRLEHLGNADRRITVERLG